MKFIPRSRDFSMGRKRRGGPEEVLPRLLPSLLLLLCVLLDSASSYGEVGESLFFLPLSSPSTSSRIDQSPPRQLNANHVRAPDVRAVPLCRTYYI